MHAIADVVTQLEGNGQEMASTAGGMQQSYHTLRDIVGRFRLR
jgi:methyl-accepting chemotaxis protein